ncbi:MAG: hypothetical protein ACHQ49_07610 [Elusimicrobiota bacterium]
MPKRIGVWLDRRTAVVVSVAEASGANPAPGVRRITTDLERQLRLSSGRRAKTSHGPQISPPDDMRETSSRENLKSFFDDVVAEVRGARAIFILGPGEAKEEFRKRLEREGLAGIISGVESAGRMSDRQLAARVREHYDAARTAVKAGARGSRTMLLAAAAGILFAAGGCASLEKNPLPIEAAGAAADRDVAASEAVNHWSDVSAAAARFLMTEYGVPDEVESSRLIWNGNGVWRRTVVRDLPPAAQEGVDLGVIEQTVAYVLTPAQAKRLAAFDDRLEYDAARREVTVRSDREEYNILRLNLADDVALGRKSPDRALDSYFKAVELEESGKSDPDLRRLRLTPH